MNQLINEWKNYQRWVHRAPFYTQLRLEESVRQESVDLKPTQGAKHNTILKNDILNLCRWSPVQGGDRQIIKRAPRAVPSARGVLFEVFSGTFGGLFKSPENRSGRTFWALLIICRSPPCTGLHRHKQEVYRKDQACAGGALYREIGK